MGGVKEGGKMILEREGWGWWMTYLYNSDMHSRCMKQGSSIFVELAFSLPASRDRALICTAHSLYATVYYIELACGLRKTMTFLGFW